MDSVQADSANKDKSSKFSYLDLLASIGSAKHIGGKGSTDVLIKEADIKPGSLVLDVGCGMGKTSCKLAKENDCRVVGLDLMPQMIKDSKARAKKLGVEDRASFIRCDARNLPFNPDVFDAVIIESVTIFAEDVRKAIDEYYRVVKTGSPVCDNEVCITRKALAEMGSRLDDLKSIFTAFSSTTDQGMLTFEDWEELFKARFGNVRSSHHLINPQVEMETRQEDGFRSFIAMIKSMWLYSTNLEAKKIMIEAQKIGQFQNEFGYGLYISRK